MGHKAGEVMIADSGHRNEGISVTMRKIAGGESVEATEKEG